MTALLAIPTDLDPATVQALYLHINEAIVQWQETNGVVGCRTGIAALLAEVCSSLQSVPEGIRAALTEEAFYMLMMNSGADPLDVFAALKRRHEADMMMVAPQGSA